MGERDWKKFWTWVGIGAFCAAFYAAVIFFVKWVT